ncbi:unnamed protein product [Lampetra fluviatilis]
MGGGHAGQYWEGGAIATCWETSAPSAIGVRAQGASGLWKAGRERGGAEQQCGCRAEQQCGCRAEQQCGCRAERGCRAEQRNNIPIICCGHLWLASPISSVGYIG